MHETRMGSTSQWWWGWVLLTLTVGCALGSKDDDDRLARLEARTGQRWRALFDPQLATARALARVGTSTPKSKPTLVATELLQAGPELARRFVADQPELFGGAAAAPGALVVKDLQADPEGGLRVRLGLRAEGLPVEGCDAVVVLDGSGHVRAAAGRFPPEERLGAEAVLPADEAAAIALSFLSTDDPSGLVLESAPQKVAALAGDELRPAWRVTIERASAASGGMPLRRELLVDAATGYLLRERNLVVSERATGEGLGVDGTLRDLEIYRMTNNLFILRDEAREVRTFTARAGGELPGLFVRSDVSDRWDADGEGRGAAVDAHVFAGWVIDDLRTIHGYTGLDGDGGIVRVVVHYGVGLANAFWDGQHAVFGDGDADVAPLAGALDVVAHELFHGVIQATSGLGYEGEAGALNESLADVFATFVEERHGDGDWTIAEDISKKPFRDLGRPERGGQPSHMRDYVDLPVTPAGDMGGVHVNSTIPSHAAFRVTMALGTNTAERIWWRAATLYLAPQARFVDFAEATRSAAEDLYGPGSQELDAVEEAWRAVGLLE